MVSLKKKILICRQNPTKLKYKEIIIILERLNFIFKEAKGSHIKVYHEKTKIRYSFALHQEDCKSYQKEAISKLLIKHHLI